MDAAGDVTRRDLRVQAVGEHAARGRALSRVPSRRDLRRDSEQVTKLQVSRIDACLSGPAPRDE